jgi:Domain of unknown function (DUF4111)
MRKIEYIDDLPKLQVGILREFPLQRGAVDYSDYSAAIQHEPGLECTQVGPLQCFSDRNIARQRLGQSAHDSDYLTRLLSRADLVGVQPLWYVDNGSTLLQPSVHDNRWHVRWVLRERAITLMGPSPGTLTLPVPMDALRAEMLTSIEGLKIHFVAEIGKPVAYFNTRFGQSFAVLTCCRVLQAFQSGAVESKLSRVQWAEQSLEAEWQELIHQAWAERKACALELRSASPLA